MNSKLIEKVIETVEVFRETKTQMIDNYKSTGSKDSKHLYAYVHLSWFNNLVDLLDDVVQGWIYDK